MNQILSIGPENNRDNRPKGPVSDKVIRIFAILLVIFAVILIGSGIYSLLQNKSSNNGVKPPTVANKTATINAIQNETDATVTITVESEIAINKVSYSWNANTDKTMDGNGSFTLEKEIDLPSGKNTLTIKVTDVENNETKQSFEFDSENGSDIISPNITLTITEEKKLLITATDETAMSHLTYRWNDEEEVEKYIDEDAEDKTTLTVELDIPRGKNIITVVAVDASKKHNSRTKTETLTGVTKPEIPLPTLSADGVLTVKCSHETGIKEIYYTLNDKAYSTNLENEEGYPDAFKDIEFTIQGEEGYNRVKLTVTSSENTVATAEWDFTIGQTDEEQEPEENDNENTNTNTNTSSDRNANTNTPTNTSRNRNSNTNTTDE